MPYGPYSLCGWRVLADLPLPELAEWSGADSEGLPLRVKWADAAPPGDEPEFSLMPQGDVILQIPGVARFCIGVGNDGVGISPYPAADPLLLRSFLYGSVLAVLCYRRGFFPLHGSAVRVVNEAIVISGPSGAGKSTTAMALARRGHALLSDDVCAMDLRDPAKPLLWPAFSRVKLLPDAMDAFALGEAALYSQAAQGMKGHFGVAAAAEVEALHGPLPVAAIYALDVGEDLGPGSGEDAKPQRFRMQGREAFAFLNGQAHRSSMARGLGLAAQVFRDAGSLAAAVPLYRLQRPHSLSRLGETIELLEQLHFAGSRDTGAMG